MTKRSPRGHDDPLRARQVAASDPIAKFIPEFAHLKVFNGSTPTASRSSSIRHAPTMPS